MTDDDKRMLAEIYSEWPVTQAKVDELHAAFFSRPPGAPETDPTAIQTLHEMQIAWRRGSWFARLVVKTGAALIALGMLLSVGPQIGAFIAWLQKLGK